MLDAQQLADSYGRITPDTQACTLRVRQSGANQASFTDYAIASVRLKKLTKEQAQMVAGGEAAYRYRIAQTWRQHHQAVSAPVPKVSDVFLVAGVEWVVESVPEVKMAGETYNSLVVQKV